MGIFNRTNKMFEGIFNRMLQIPPNMNTTAYQDLYSELGWVHACINRIAQTVADTELYATDMKGNIKDDGESVALAVLQNPNPYMSEYELKEKTIKYLESCGVAFWFLARENKFNMPRAIWLLNPSMVYIIPDETGNYIKNYIFKSGAEEMPLSTDEVIMFMLPDLVNPYKGTSPLRALGYIAETEKYANQWNRNFFFNSATPNAIITTKNKLNDKVFERIKEQFARKYGGLDNAHKTAVIEAEIDYKQIGINQKDSDFNVMKQMNRDEICSVFGVPKVLLGLTDGVNYSTANVQESIYMKNTIRPLLRLIENKINNEFIPLFKIEHGRTIIKFKETVVQDREYIKSVLDNQVNKSITVNEARKIWSTVLNIELEPLKNGDVLHTDNQINTSEIDNSEDQKAFKKKDLIVEANKELKNKSSKFNKDMVALSIKLEKNFNKKIKAYLEKQEEEIVQNIMDGKTEVLIDAKWNEELTNIAKKHFENVYKVAGQYSLDTTKAIITPIFTKEDAENLNLSFNYKDPNIVEEILKRCELIVSINDTTRETVRNIIAESFIGKTFSIADVKERLVESGLFNNNRATTIAQTETMTAVNSASFQAYKQNEDIIGFKCWLNNADDLVRPSHVEAGQTYTESNPIPLDKDFIVGGNTCQHPHDSNLPASESINCRCTIMPILK